MRTRLLVASVVVISAVGLGAGSPSGTITASPQVVTVASGTAAPTTIAWSTNGCSTAQVCVSMDGSAYALMAESTAGSVTVPWIVGGHSYVFRLTAERAQSVVLATVDVTTVAPGTSPGPGISGSIAATPQVVSIAAGQLGTSVVSWSTQGAPGAEVWVQFQGHDSNFASGAQGSQSAPWIQIGGDYEFDLYAGPRPSALLASIHVTGVIAAPPPRPPAPSYRVGVDYHATTSDLTSVFLTRYQDPAVRATVQQQLQGMADAGANYVSTRIWMLTSIPGPLSANTWGMHFPPDAQDLANIHAYAQDVAATQAKDGHYLTLDFCLLRLWGADYQTGSPTTTLGKENLSPADFTQREQTAESSVLDQLRDVYRPDGKLVTQTFYMEGEVMIGAKPNQDWFLTTFYPTFVQEVSAAGITPSMYFLVAGNEAEVLDDTFVDATYPELDGHRSMFWVYRSLRFMKDNGLPLPARMDASTYVAPVSSTYDVLVKRVYDDADATLVPLGMSGKYGVAETFYYPDTQATQRRALGKAFADEAVQRQRLEQLSFWTTPDAGGTGVDAGYPFAIADYEP